MTRKGSEELRSELLRMVATPAACGAEVIIEVDWFVSPGALPSGAPMVLNSTPEDAVVSLDMIVLLIMFTTSASCSETPAPSQPATLLLMMLLVTATEYQRVGLVGKKPTSVPFTDCSRRPPPLPLSAPLPMIMLALITSPGPVPSLRPGAQSTSVTLPHSVPAAAPTGVPSGAAPMTMRPPPLVGTVGLVLWLNRIWLCSMSPFQEKPTCASPPPSPVLRLPHTQL